MSVALALYKGKGNWVNSLIRWQNQSPYSHCELIVDGWMYSSTVHDGGVRCKLQTYLREEDWDIIPINFNNGESILKHYVDTKDHPYGWRDLFQTQIFGRRTADDKGDFCSEWCLAALGLDSPSSYKIHQVKGIVEWANSLYPHT